MSEANPAPVAWDLPAKPLPPLAGQIVPPDGPAERIARLVVWVVGIGVLFLLARIVQAARGLAEPASGRGNGYDTAYATGEVAGYVAGSLLLAALLRWAYLRLRHRKGSVRSPWLIGIAALVLLFNLAGATTTAPAAATNLPAAATNPPAAAQVDPQAAAKRIAARLQIASPYRLGPAPDEARTALLDPIAAQGARAGYRAGDIMAILDEFGPVGYLVVIDIGMTAGGSDAYLDGFIKGATRQGATARRDVVDGQALGIATSDDHTLIGWTEPPLVMMVVGFDDASAIELTRATLAP